MDIGLMLKQSWQIVWRHKFLWVLGFFAGLNGILFNLIRLFFGSRITSQTAVLWEWAQQPQPAPLPYEFNVTEADFGRYFMGFVVLLFVVFIGFWVIATIAEAGIMQTTINLERDEPVGLGQSVRAGWGWLGRFVAIDAVVFFPWFLVALTIMLIMIALTLMVGYLGINNAELSNLFVVLGIGGLCLIPLLLLLLPIAWLSFIYRTLAFRDAAYLDHSVMQSVKHTWVVVKQHWGNVFLVTLVMIAVQAMSGWVIDLISLPIYGGLAYLGAESVLGTVIGVLFVLFTAVISGIVYAYIATAWTISYKVWIDNKLE